MAVFLLKIIFMVLSSLTNIVTRLVFSGTAFLLVLAIQAIKAPGYAINGMLEQVTNVVKTVLEYVFELIMEVVSSIISECFDLLKEAVSGSVSMTGGAVVDLVSEMKSALDDLSKDLPEVLEGLSEMIWKMVLDAWNNYKDAIGYVWENIS